MDKVAGALIAPHRFWTVVMAVFTTVAMLLGVVGIFGVVAFMVGLRRREMAIPACAGK